jgi:multiple sugar transport system substrate-binding protein
MKNINIFQVVVLGLFIAFAIGGVFVISQKGSNKEDVVPLTIWGTFDQEAMDAVISAETSEDGGLASYKLTYQELDPAEFDTTLAEAIATGQGPDLILLPSDRIVRHSTKIYPIPYDSYSEREFKTTFTEMGELYLTSEGILGLPVVMDPLVLYWNRDLFANAKITLPPATWEEFMPMVNSLTKIDTSRQVLESAISMGEYVNIPHAAEIMSALFLQSGNPITTRVGSKIVATFGQSQANQPGAEAALRFYTQFADPVKSTYTWNRSLPTAEQQFLAGKLAMYPGFASELPELRAKNPNLNFAVTLFPQSETAARQTTFAHMDALAVLKTSRNIPASIALARAFTDPAVLTTLVEKSYLPPVRRDMLAAKPAQDWLSVFYDSAAIARGWIEPGPQTSENVFADMIEDVTSGRSTVVEALNRGGAELSD